MIRPKNLAIATLAALAFTATAAGPAAASHGKAHKQARAHHHRATVPSGTPPSQPNATTPAISRIGPGGRPIRLILGGTVGGTVVAMQTGTWQHGNDDDDCQIDADTANMWQEKGDYLAGQGDQAGAAEAYDNASTVAGEANAGGCNLFLNDNA